MPISANLDLRHKQPLTAGTRPISAVSVASLIQLEDSETTYISSANSPAIA